MDKSVKKRMKWINYEEKNGMNKSLEKGMELRKV